MEGSNFTKAKESQSHVDCILQCQGHCPQQVLATGTNNQPACLQRDPAIFSSFIAGEEERVWAEQLVDSYHGNALAHSAFNIGLEHCFATATSLLTQPSSM